ncbi:MAG: 4,5-DOPA dioxygenase extradiol [Hydrogenophaga sp.]|uniref:4,5-DOPA-extradiol-dioxygenase n=1 Tax=Hydrogenophaga sp. TaxID=1904254 RepID=UPI001DE7E06E|nr:4,5-DOPA dioxygenase extradiol [Hydrogenophaga sp.]MBX3610951.1 4,5-DOPA dioxygenase extradiol [Hydrogenophaga sp.]
MNRRRLLSSLSALAAVTPLVEAATGGAAPRQRMPVIFIGHGSPMNAISDNAFTQTLAAWGQRLPRPAAILSVSAHWLTPGATLVDVQARPRTIHDFGGFPQALHDMQYPAPGAPETAQIVRALVKSRKVAESDDWGLDHGTWTVLHHLIPKAEVPTFQLSIDYSAPGAVHHALGRELAALRDRGVLIVGSGNIVHNLRATVRNAPPSAAGATPWARDFDAAVRDALADRSFQNEQRLMQYERLGAGAAMAVPTPDHYWPFLYALGASDPREKLTTTYEGFHAGTLSMRCLQWG